MIIESRNVIDKMHWSEKSKLVKQYRVFIRQQMSKRLIKEASAGEFWNLSITTYRNRKVRDHDNLVAGAKQLLDALSHEGFIWDDAEEYIGKPTIEQYLVSEGTISEPHTVIIRKNGKSDRRHVGHLVESKLQLAGRKKGWLAKQCAVTPQTVTRWIKTGVISSSKRGRIKELLGIDIEDRRLDQN